MFAKQQKARGRLINKHELYLSVYILNELLVFNLQCFLFSLIFSKREIQSQQPCKGQGYLGGFQELQDIWGSSPWTCFLSKKHYFDACFALWYLTYILNLKKNHQFIFTVNKKRVGRPPGNLSQARFGP